jgi:hypothetical protein
MLKPGRIFCIMIVVSAAAAYAGVGSVISSFYLGYDLYSGIYRDRNYVYTVLYRIDADVRFITKRTATGSNASIVCSLSRGSYADADHSPLGDGYFSLTASGTPDVVHDRNSGTGSVVASWSPREDIWAYAYVPGGRYKYVSDGERIFRYTLAGTFVSSFGARCVSLAATSVFCGQSGEYVVAAGDDVITIFRSGGTFVRSFAAPRDMENGGACCGPGYPDDCGTTLWCIYYGDFWPFYYDPYVYQISLGNGIAVAPTSVGRIKALFR